jgi:hypothetical protein
MMTQIQATIGGGQEGGSAVDMDTMVFLMELPLRDLFHFQEAALPMSPEEIVDGLLAQVSQNN